MVEVDIKVVKKKSRKKHVPQRTCVGCREVVPKRSLTRIVRTTEGVVIDSTGKLAGRGSYLHDLQSCWDRGLKGPLAHALRTELSSKDKEILLAYMETLPMTDSEDAILSDEQVGTK